MCSQLPEPLDDIVAGLRAEARALRRRTPSDTSVAKLSHGRSVEQQHSETTYRFTIEHWPKQLASNRDLLIQRGEKTEWYPIERCEVSGKHVTVTCASDLGKSDVVAQLREDDAAWCAVLIRALQEIGTEHGGAALRRGCRALGTESVKTANFTDAETVTSGLGRLNEAQQHAVRRALGSELTYLWGPPGTGKTEVVARIVEGYVRRGFRVLFTAPTNVAVDQALERVCDLLSPVPEFDRGLVRRIGDIHVSKLRGAYGNSIDRDETVSRHSQELNRRAKELRETQQSVAADLQLLTHLEQLSRQLQAKQEQRANYAQRLGPHRDRVREIESTIATLERRFAEQRPRSGFLRRRYDAKRERWNRELYAQREAMSRMQDAISGPAAALQRLEKEIADLQQRLKQDTPDGLGSRRELEHCAEQTRQGLDGVTAQLQQIEREVDQNCRVAAMPTQRSYWGRPPLASVDVVVVDEAGMVDLPTVFYLSSVAKSSVVFAGDFRQLPAVVAGNTDKDATPQDQVRVRDWFAADAFHAGGVATRNGIKTDDRRLVRLDTQYRMRQGICELVNTVAYPDAPLVTGRDDDTAVAHSPLLESPLILIDTSQHTGGNGTVYLNRVHAALIREFVRLLQHDKVLPPRRAEGSDPADKMAAIAPYRQQVRAIGTQLKERFGSNADGIVDTVHRFQGSQRPIIIVDTVTGSNKKLANFFTGVGFDSDTCRLLNVALSRARDHLIVLANVEHLAAKLRATSEVHHLIDHMKHRAQLVSPDDLIPVRAADDLGKLDDEDLTRPAFFPADETDKAVEWDFSRANNRIEIYCAFMNHPRVQRYRKPLRAAMQRGVRVSVFTRDTTEVPANETHIESLRGDGCEVVTRDQMHEKVVVVDDTLWHGSLNLFAHTRSTELMMRLVSSDACDEVRRTVENANPTRERPGESQEDRSEPGRRMYLEVPYAEKDYAKKRGARWDPKKKKWWIDLNKHTPDEFARWIPCNA